MRTYHTKQRERLLECLQRNADSPLSAEELAQELCRDGESISVSAVYRNLSTLALDGTVRRFTAEDGRTALYQYADCDNCDAHLHLKCTVCGRLIHMEEGVSDLLLQAVTGSNDFAIDEKKTVLYGVCGKCKDE